MSSSDTQREHPCAKFQRGEVKDFYTAMEVYVAQYREELRESREIYQRFYTQNTPEQNQKFRKENEEQAQGVAEIEKIVEQARAIYDEIVGEATKRAAQAIRESGNNYHVLLIADALERGTYEGLSV